MYNVVAICVGVCGLVLFTYLLITKAIGPGWYSGLIVALLLASIGISAMDRLAEFDLKNAKLTLREMKEVRDDVYAKAERVQRLGEQIAALATWNVRSINRSLDDEQPKQMVAQREQIASMLRDLGTSEERIREIVINPINETVLADLRMDLRDYFKSRASRVGGGPEEYWSQVDPVLRDFNPDRVVELAKRLNVYDPELDGKVDRFDRFLKGQRL